MKEDDDKIPFPSVLFVCIVVDALPWVLTSIMAATLGVCFSRISSLKFAAFSAPYTRLSYKKPSSRPSTKSFLMFGHI